MANADLNRLFDHARIRLPGALDATIKLELFALMNDFFQSSNIWYEDITVQVFHTDDDRVVSPESFSYELVPELGSITRLGLVMDSKGIQRAAVMPLLGTMVLGVSPDTDDTYKCRCFLTVTDPVTRDGIPVFPAWVLNKYGTDILDGLLGRMMSQLAKPYSNAQLAVMHSKKFANATAQAKVEALHQNVYRGQSWRFPQTFQVRRFRHI
jgi:hypothetical protein